MQIEVTRRTAAAATTWAAAVALALRVTLGSLAETDFDGLNNMFQIPFALPWFLLPIATSNHEQNAWVTAAMGWLNAAIILLFGRAIARRLGGKARP